MTEKLTLKIFKEGDGEVVSVREVDKAWKVQTPNARNYGRYRDMRPTPRAASIIKLASASRGRKSEWSK